MFQVHDVKKGANKAADIVRDAGGRIVGRTRLQKVAYLLELAGLGDGFSFSYRHYGPYSDELANSILFADFLGYLKEEEHTASWGGSYSIFNADTSASTRKEPARHALIAKAIDADSIVLELAATAAFFAAEGNPDPWAETARRKPDKAEQRRLERAKSLYNELRKMKTPRALPKI